MQNVLSPDPNSVEYPQINIFIPHIKLFPATLISLIGYNYTAVYAPGDYEVGDYFKERWREGKTFINIEQDIVPWPGAIKAIWDCPQEWCVYDMHLPCHWGRNLENEVNGIPLGCMKISAEVIKKTPGIWDEPVKWTVMDIHLTKQFLKRGLKVHQHHPGVVNANPALLGFVEMEENGNSI